MIGAFRSGDTEANERGKPERFCPIAIPKLGINFPVDGVMVDRHAVWGNPSDQVEGSAPSRRCGESMTLALSLVLLPSCFATCPATPQAHT